MTVGVQSRNFSNARMYSIGWEAKVFLEEGIGLTYPWIEAQVMETKRCGDDSALAGRAVVSER